MRFGVLDFAMSPMGKCISYLLYGPPQTQIIHNVFISQYTHLIIELCGGHQIFKPLAKQTQKYLKKNFFNYKLGWLIL
jgi:hypothetical protein